MHCTQHKRTYLCEPPVPRLDPEVQRVALGHVGCVEPEWRDCELPIQVAVQQDGALQQRGADGNGL